MILKFIKHIALGAAHVSKTPASHGVELTDSLKDTMAATGRVSTAYLINLARSRSRDSFILFVNCPVLASSTLRDGSLSAATHPSSTSLRTRAKTLLFKPALLLKRGGHVADTEPLQRAIYPLTKSSESPNPDPYLFTIGRERGNDLVIPDFAISRQHAVIKFRGRSVSVADLDSSNGTFVNELKVGPDPVELREHDKVRFGRLEFVLLLPTSLYELAQTSGMTQPE